ncbi:MAG: YcaO-like family protein [Desulforhopalus sp.]
MENKTHLTGKDVSLEETIQTATTNLENIGITTKAVSWLNPAPNCWSVHIQSSACSHLYTNGKGTSRLASLASGLGEFLERLSTNFLFADFFWDEGDNDKPFQFYPNETWFSDEQNFSIPERNKDGIKLLSEPLLSFYNPDGELAFEHLLDNNTNSSSKGICALPFQSLTSKKMIYFPVSLLNNLYVSNGMAAGNSPAECCSQALSEILERYVKNIIIAEGLSLPNVPMTSLRNFTNISSILQKLTDEGFAVQVKDASLGGKFPVISVLLTDSRNGGAFAAFGANCRFETAIERTLTELLQGRSFDRLRDFLSPCHDKKQVADPFNLESHFVDSDGLLSWDMFKDKADFDYCPWDFSGSTQQELKLLENLITSNGFDMFRAEYLHCGMYSCRILVPGMSEIYPVDDLLWNNKVTGAHLRPYLLRLPRMEKAELYALFDLIETLGLNDQLLLSQIIGILFDTTSAWATLSIGELKALLLLASNRTMEALQWCSWCLEYGSLPEKRIRLFKLLETLLNFHMAEKDLADYQAGLQLFYKQEEIHEAESIINGRMRFPGLNFGGTWMEISSEQKNLLTIYEQVNRLKADFAS